MTRPYRPSDSQSSGDYSSDSDFDETPSISHTPSFELKSFKKNKQGASSASTQQTNEIILGGRTFSQLKDLLTLSSCDLNYELGGQNWRSFWSSSLVDLGVSYYHYKDQSQVSSSDKSKSSNKSFKNTSLPTIASHHHPSTSTSTSASLSSSDQVGVSLLTQEKQKYVLSILNQMEEQLEQTNNDPFVTQSFTEKNSEIVNSITRFPESQQQQQLPLAKLSSHPHPPHPSLPPHHSSSKVSSNIQYAFENKIKYGHVRGVLEKVTTVMRKIRKEIGKLTAKDRKELIDGHVQVSPHAHTSICL